MNLDHDSDGVASLERAKNRLKRQVIFLFLLFVAVVVAQRYIDRQLHGPALPDVEQSALLDHEVSLESASAAHERAQRL